MAGSPPLPTRRRALARWIGVLAVLGALAAGLPRIEEATSPLGALPPDPEGEAERATQRAVFGPERVLTVLLVRQAGVFAEGPLRSLVALGERIAAQPWAASVEGVTLTPVLRPDDTGALQATPLFAAGVPADPAALESARSAALGSPFVRGVLLSPDARATAVHVTLADWTVAGRTTALVEAASEADLVPPTVAAGLRDTLQQARLAAVRARALDPGAPAPEAAIAGALDERAKSDPDVARILAGAGERAAADVRDQAVYATLWLRGQGFILEGRRDFDRVHVLGAHVLLEGVSSAWRSGFQRLVAVWGTAATVLVLLGVVSLRLRPVGACVAVGFAALGAIAGGAGWLGVPVGPEVLAAVVTGAVLAAAACVPVPAGTPLSGRLAPLGAGIAGLVGAGVWLVFEPATGLSGLGAVLLIAGAVAALAVLLPPFDDEARARPRSWIALSAGVLSSALFVGNLAHGRPRPPSPLAALPDGHRVQVAYAEAARALPGSLAWDVLVTAPGTGEAPLLDPAALSALARAERAATEVPGVVSVLGPAGAVSLAHAAASGQAGLPASRDAASQELMMFGSPRLIRPFLDEGFTRARLLVRVDEPEAGAAAAALSVEKAVRAALGPDWGVLTSGDLPRYGMAQGAAARASLLAAVIAAAVAAAVTFGCGLAARRPLRGIAGSLFPHLAVALAVGATVGPGVPWTGVALFSAVLAAAVSGVAASAWAEGHTAFATGVLGMAFVLALLVHLGAAPAAPLAVLGRSTAIPFVAVGLLLRGLGDGGAPGRWKIRPYQGWTQTSSR